MSEELSSNSDRIMLAQNAAKRLFFERNGDSGAHV